jgi:hypothetical protein
MIFINMKTKKHIVESIELTRIEKSFRKDVADKYFFNLKLSGIEDYLLLESEFMLDNLIVGRQVTYTINDENIITNLIFQ